MKTVMMNGKEYVIPTRSNGSINANELKKILGISGNRQLISLGSERNEIMPSSGQVVVSNSQHFMDAPKLIRGGE